MYFDNSVVAYMIILHEYTKFLVTTFKYKKPNNMHETTLKGLVEYILVIVTNVFGALYIPYMSSFVFSFKSCHIYVDLGVA